MSKIIKFEKSFASSDKSNLWSSKNKLLTSEISKYTTEKYLFECNQCMHEFLTSPAIISRSKSSGCPYCNNVLLCDKDCEFCYNKSFASHEKSVFWSDENNIDKRKVFKNTIKKYKFTCKCAHTFESSPGSINKNNSWCPYCSGLKICGQCEICIKKSFASNEKAIFWSELNKDKPENIFKSCKNKYYFNCNCGHTILKSPRDIARGIWCSYCSNQLLCGNCDECNNKSFAKNEKSLYLRDKDKIEVNKIFKGSDKKLWFICNKCNHDFESSINEVVHGSWCPYCANLKLCSIDKDCIYCFKKTFADHEKSIFWSSKNEILPNQVVKNTNKSYIFNCEKGHEFSKNIWSISKGSWCPYCVNKTETKLYNKLILIYPSIKRQFKAKWCKNEKTNRCYPYDFIIPELNIIIELDGRQHFMQVYKWNNPKDIQDTDIYKIKLANQNNISVIRILQEDVFYDTYDWLNELKENINKITTLNKINNIFMCKNNEYESYYKLLNIE